MSASTGYPVTPSSGSPTRPRGNGIGVTALVLGILAVVLSWLPVVGFVLAVLALIFGIIGIFNSHKGMSIAGTATGAVALIAAIVVTAAIGNVLEQQQRSTGTNPTTAPAAPVQNTAPTAPETTTPPVMPTAADFQIGLKTTSKQCFGSAGCSVVVQPELTYTGADSAIFDTQTCDITYRITGDSSGPMIETANGTGGMSYSVSPSSLSTASNSTVVHAEIQDVTCQ
ncbi:hypothetical protein [Sciscionella sediminilitoris]|uniref:hypothetical protein n=1 Tax=Sciscionella sediminilitoris TaxID=1445613 RepID=UPI0006EBC251|nr:hypothetical protein [Sciscionella sp. SE31]